MEEKPTLGEIDDLQGLSQSPVEAPVSAEYQDSLLFSVLGNKNGSTCSICNSQFLLPALVLHSVKDLIITT